MKALTIKQPWASMIVQGYKDVENRNGDTTYRGKVLIHAAADRRHWGSLRGKAGYDIMGLDIMEVINEHLFGNLEDKYYAEYSAIIGYATLVDVVEDSDSIWAHHGSKHWIFKDAYVFDEPIRNVRSKQGLWDYPEIAEDNLPPAHKFERKYAPSVEGDTICIPVMNDKIFDIHKFDFVELEYTDEIRKLLIDKELKIKPFTHVKLYTNNDSITHPITQKGDLYVTREDDLESWVYYKDQYGEEDCYHYLRFEFPNCKKSIIRPFDRDRHKPNVLDFLTSLFEQYELNRYKPRH